MSAEWTRRVRPVLAVLAVSALLLLAACGGGGDGDGVDATTGLGGSATAAPGGSGSGSTPTASGGLEAQTFTVGEHFWHSGFRVDVTDGEIIVEENQLTGAVRHSLALNAKLENTGVDNGFFGPPLAVVTANNSYTSDFQSDIPDVPGGLTSNAVFRFAIDDAFDLASAYLLIGRPDESQAQVPLAGGGDAVRLEPSELAISGSLSMQLLDLNFTSASLRHDLPQSHRQVEAGKQALTLNFDAVSRKDGNWQLFAADFALIGPDGTAIVPDAIEIGSLPGSDEGVTTADRYVRFLVDEMPAGDYTLRLTPGGWFVGDDGVEEATFDFALGS